MRIFLLIFLSIIITSCDKYESDCCGTPTLINLSYPTSFPDPYNPLDNNLSEEGVNLGRHLFYDPILSSDNTVSCASCHKQEYAFGDNTQYSFGVNQSVGERNASTIINTAFQTRFDWDGKSTSLEDQADIFFQDSSLYLPRPVQLA